MRIGELAGKAGVDVQTVRYYEREGLIELSSDRSVSCDEVNALLHAHLARVRSKLAALRDLEKQLAALDAQCSAGHRVADCGILEELIRAAHGEACACHPAGADSRGPQGMKM